MSTHCDVETNQASEQWPRHVGLAFGRVELLVAAAGVVTGGIGAVAYYSAPFRELAHAFLLWIVLTAVVARSSRPAPAVARSTITLFCAVLSFYVGKRVVYTVEYGRWLPPSVFHLVVWGALAGVAGVVLGLSFRWIGHPGLPGTVATATTIGLVWGDVFRRTGFVFVPDPVLLVCAIFATVLLLAMGLRKRGQLRHIGALAVPAAGVGYLVTSGPDLLEQVLITGSFSGIF